MQLNMWWLFLIQVLTTWIINLDVRSKNIIKIRPTHKTPFWHEIAGASESFKVKKTIRYDSNALKRMQSTVKHDSRYRILPFGTANRIRELRLNIKKRKHRHRPKWIQHPTKAVLDNLSRIRNENHTHKGNIIMGQCNIQSIKAKFLQVSELLHDYSLDILLLTETWPSERDKEWMDCYEFNHDPYQMFAVHRGSAKRGGGLGLITKSHLNIKQLGSRKTDSFEYGTWQIKSRGTAITLTGVYHPAYSLTNKTTNAQFTDEFLNFMTEILPLHNNHIIMGDFNLHLSKEDNTDASIFLDSIEAMGLYQHISFLTHCNDNLLDLVISEITGKII